MFFMNDFVILMNKIVFSILEHILKLFFNRKHAKKNLLKAIELRFLLK